MTLIRTIRRLVDTQRLIDEQQKLIQDQARLIDEYQSENRRIRLEAMREQHGLVAGWLIHTERPEIDMRDELAALDTVLAHSIATLEEYIL